MKIIYHNTEKINIIWLKYLFRPHFRSVCCRWSSFWQNV